VRRLGALLAVAGLCFAACGGNSVLGEAGPTVSDTPATSTTGTAQTTSTTTAVPPTTTTMPPTTTTAVLDVNAGVWARVPPDEAVFGGADYLWIEAVTAGGPGLVAVGHEIVNNDSVAVVWVSPDGLSWTRPPAVRAPGYQRMLSVAAGPSRLVAVGFDGSNAAVWTSADGMTWSQVPHHEALSGGVMWSVMAGGPGLVAVGNDGWFGSSESTAAVWTSPDGFTWTRVPHDDDVFGHPAGGAMNSVAPGGPGLIAVGRDASGGDGDAAVWTSPDGLTWTRVPHDDEVFSDDYGSRMFSVASGGPGLVAVGSADVSPEGDEGNFAALTSLRDAAVWTSPDGLTWTRVPHIEAVFGGHGEQEMRAVVAGGPGLVAVGESDFAAAVWTSPDGLTWTRVPHDEEVFGGDSGQVMFSVVAVGRGLVAVGQDHRNAPVWYWTPDE
jgi:hypothetical protein